MKGMQYCTGGLHSLYVPFRSFDLLHGLGCSLKVRH
jgi:hypothetical protein